MDCNVSGGRRNTALAQKTRPNYWISSERCRMKGRERKRGLEEQWEKEMVMDDGGWRIGL